MGEGILTSNGQAVIESVNPAGAVRAETGAAKAVTVHGVADGPEPPASDRKLRILVADDSHQNQLLIKSFLKKRPFKIDVADNGEDALAAF